MRHLVGRPAVALARGRGAVAAGIAYVDADQRVGAHPAAAVVDVVVEGHRSGAVGHREDQGLAVGTDLHAGPATGLVHAHDAEQAALGRGVVVERVQHRRPAGADAVGVGLGLGRTAVGVVGVALLVVLLGLLLGGEGLPVVDLHRLVVVDVPDGAAGGVVEHDLATVDAEGEVGGVAAQLGDRGVLRAALDRDVALPARPGAVGARPEADRLHRVARGGGCGDRGGLTGVEVDGQELVGRDDQHGVGRGTGLLEDAAGRHGGGRPTEGAHHARRLVEGHHPLADRGDARDLAGVTGQVLGDRFAEPCACGPHGRDRPLLGGGDHDGAALAHGEGRPLTGLDQRIGLAVDEVHDRLADHVVVADGPDLAGLGVRTGQGAAGHLHVAVARDGRGAAVEGLELARLDGLAAQGVDVEGHDGRAVLDDVHAGLAVVAGHDAVELVDRLVEPARPSLGPVDDPDATVVEVRLVGLVAARGDGIDDDGGHGDGQSSTGGDRPPVSLHEPPPCHEYPPRLPAPTAGPRREGMYRGKVRTSRAGCGERV